MGKLNIDLGGIMGLWGDKTPQANPLYGANYDPDQDQWNYSDGTAVSNPDHLKALNDSAYAKSPDDVLAGSADITKQKYTTPSDWTQTFHPDVANFETKANIAGVQANQDAQNEQDLKNSINARQAGFARPALSGANPSSLDNNILGILNNGNFSAQNNNAVAASQASLAAGLPQVQTDAEKQQAIYAAEKDAQQRRVLSSISLQGGDEKEALNTISGLDYGTSRNIAGQYLLPRETMNTSLHLGNDNAYQTNNVPLQQANDLGTEKIRSSVLGAQARGAIARANLEAGQSEQSLMDEPYTNYARHLDSIQQAYASNRGPIASSPFMNEFNPDGTVKTNVRQSIPGMADMLNAKVNSGMTGNSATPPISIVGKDGKPGPMPPPSIYGPHSVPVMQGQPVPTSASNPTSMRAPISDSIESNTGISQAEQPDYFSSINSKGQEEPKVDQVPLQGRPGYSYDGKGNIYYEGKKVNLVEGSDIKEEAQQQLRSQERDNLIKRTGMGYRPIIAQPSY